MTRTVIIAGEGEYGSDRTMRHVADDLSIRLGHTVTYCVPDVLPDMPEFPLSSIDGLCALADADLLMIYTRFRQLPDQQMEAIADYLQRGGAVIGLRTSTHAFHYPAGSAWAKWNDGFGREVLGSPWVRHHGHGSSTIVRRSPDIEHPILEGVKREFRSQSWLYLVQLQPDCWPLLYGEPHLSASPAEREPVCWFREDQARRVVYTSLGHQDDFQIPSFRRLILNAARWCTAVG